MGCRAALLPSLCPFRHLHLGVCPCFHRGYFENRCLRFDLDLGRGNSSTGACDPNWVEHCGCDRGRLEMHPALHHCRHRCLLASSPAWEHFGLGVWIRKPRQPPSRLFPLEQGLMSCCWPLSGPSREPMEEFPSVRFQTSKLPATSPVSPRAWSRALGTPRAPPSCFRVFPLVFPPSLPKLHSPSEAGRTQLLLAVWLCEPGRSCCRCS
mmetsp:Transcript_99132/g.206647  ORF Transcript_99132/g.206647 Transcript_99132/m.206647 type:complete len:209 (+) Transcript_99132:284-910(+)